MEARPEELAQALIIDCRPLEHAPLIRTLARFGTPGPAFAQAQGARIVTLARKQRYSQASPALRRLGVDVDSWPAPPAGLFVVEERSVYLCSRSPMTAAHEFGHALDCALGGGIYRSSVDPTLRALFREATEFVTPYAATSPDEYFAECIRAYVAANDSSSLWPRATRRRLRSIDPGMFNYLAQVFENFYQYAA